MLQYIIGQQNPLSYECHVKERIVELKCEHFLWICFTENKQWLTKKQIEEEKNRRFFNRVYVEVKSDFDRGGFKVTNG